MPLINKSLMGISYVDTDPKHFPGTSGRGGALFTLTVRVLFPGPQPVSFPRPQRVSGLPSTATVWAHPFPRSRQLLEREPESRPTSGRASGPSFPTQLCLPPASSHLWGWGVLPGCHQAHRCAAWRGWRGAAGRGLQASTLWVGVGDGPLWPFPTVAASSLTQAHTHTHTQLTQRSGAPGVPVGGLQKDRAMHYLKW